MLLKELLESEDNMDGVIDLLSNNLDMLGNAAEQYASSKKTAEDTRDLRRALSKAQNVFYTAAGNTNPNSPFNGDHSGINGSVVAEYDNTIETIKKQIINPLKDNGKFNRRNYDLLVNSFRQDVGTVRPPLSQNDRPAYNTADYDTDEYSSNTELDRSRNYR